MKYLQVIIFFSIFSKYPRQHAPGSDYRHGRCIRCDGSDQTTRPAGGTICARPSSDLLTTQRDKCERVRFATVLYDRDGCGEMGRPLTDKILPLQLCHALSLRWSHGLEVDVAVATRGLGKRHSRMHTYHHGHNTSRRAIASCTQHWRLALRGDFIMSENFNLRAVAISTINPVNKYLAALDLR